MAVTRLTDLIVPSIFDPYVQELSVEMNGLIASGIVETRPDLSAKLNGGGRTFDMPFYRDLSNTESNVSSDDPTSYSTPLNITTGQAVAIRHSRNQSWSDMDLEAALIGDDPLQAIARLVAGYWVRQDQRLLLASLVGVIADNEANDAGDMVYDVSNDAAGDAVAGELFSGENFIATEQTMGDAQAGLAAVCMHSVVYARARVLDLIDYALDSQGAPTIPTYMGKRVIVDDQVTATAGTYRTAYNTYLFGLGAFGFGEGTPRTPSEAERVPSAGDGGGQEVLYSRREFILHPPGFAWQSSSMAGESPTNTELQAAANWDRVAASRKSVRIAVLRTNG
jgi:hypothetical protein